MIATRLVPVFLFIGLSAAMSLSNPDDNDSDRCGGALTTRHGTISSPDSAFFVHLYPNDVHCEWIVNIEPGKNTQFRLTSMSLQSSAACRSEYVEIRQVRGDKDVVLGRYCGSAVPAVTLVSNASVKIIFHAKAALSTVPGSFELRYGTEEDSPGTDYGTLSAPNVTGLQPYKWEWAVSSRPGRGTRFEIVILSTNKNPDCEHDYYLFKMQVVNPLKVPADPPIYLQACNRERTWILTSPGPSTTITFVPDSGHTPAGFRLSYTSVEN